MGLLVNDGNRFGVVGNAVPPALPEPVDMCHIPQQDTLMLHFIWTAGSSSKLSLWLGSLKAKAKLNPSKGPSRVGPIKLSQCENVAFQDRMELWIVWRRPGSSAATTSRDHGSTASCTANMGPTRGCSLETAPGRGWRHPLPSQHHSPWPGRESFCTVLCSTLFSLWESAFYPVLKLLDAILACSKDGQENVVLPPDTTLAQFNWCHARVFRNYSIAE